MKFNSYGKVINNVRYFYKKLNINNNILISFSKKKTYCDNLLLGTTSIKNFPNCKLFFYSINFNLDFYIFVNYFYKIKFLGKVLIRDIHNKYKKDSPSGTSIFLKSFSNLNIKFESIRIGNVFGIHDILMFNRTIISIRNEILNFKSLLIGILKSVFFMANVKNGKYSIGDIL
ncbi:dihydrodipicolinate reductase C-terminal domain-containing protein [Candidatus Vidania fulgoroideorum]